MDEFYIHTVMVRPLVGHGGLGPVHGDPVELVCLVEDKRHLVRDQNGAEVVSETTLYAPPDAPVTVGSTVDLPRGRTATVLAVSTFDSGPLELPDHVQVALT